MKQDLMNGNGAGRMSEMSLFERAKSVIPGGVSSPVRAFGSVGGAPVFIAQANGAHVVDTAGNTYVDLVCSWGPALLGHAHPEVVAAVREAAGRGLSFGAPTAAEVELAEAIRARQAVCVFPWQMRWLVAVLNRLPRWLLALRR